MDNVCLSKMIWSVSASPCVLGGFNYKSVNVWRGEGHAIIVGVGGRSVTDGLTLPKQRNNKFSSLDMGCFITKDSFTCLALGYIMFSCPFRMYPQVT